jgi:hypothetical protein
MGDLERAIAELLIERSIDLSRLSVDVQQKVIKLLMRMQKELQSKLAMEDDLTDFGKQRLNALLRDANATIKDYYSQSYDEMSSTIDDLVPLEAQDTAKMLSSALEFRLEAGLPTATVLEKIASDVLIQGAPSKAWWEKQAASTAFNFAGAVRQGILQGETNQQIIARVIGSRDAPGIMDVSRANGAALVHTSVQTVANEARLATFKANTDIMEGMRWLTALDSHVCPLCAARAELVWTMDHEPIGHHIPFRNPPIHFNDRCLLVPKMRTYKEMGIDIEETKIGTRASDRGQVPATMTFNQFLQGKTEEQQNEILGVGKADLWRRGAITLQQLLDQRGRPLTLEQLRNKYASR